MSPGEEAEEARPGGSGNSESVLLLRMLFRSAGLIEVDMERTGAMTEVVTERGGTMRDETERGPWKVFVGREPGLDSVRVRGRV